MIEARDRVDFCGSMTQKTLQLWRHQSALLELHLEAEIFWVCNGQPLRWRVNDELRVRKQKKTLWRSLLSRLHNPWAVKLPLHPYPIEELMRNPVSEDWEAAVMS